MKINLLKMNWSTFFTWNEFWAWSEVWALLIPLTVLILRRKYMPSILKPVAYYIVIAFVLNFMADFSWRFYSPRRLNIPWMWNNSSVYHTHSIARLLLFAWFFNLLKEPFLIKIKRLLPYIFLLFVIIIFTIVKPITSFLFDYNSELHATEAAVLLFYCLQHYLYLSQQEYSPATQKTRSVAFIIAGLTIYVAINFFIFLFYSALMKISRNFAKDIWDVHNISYIILCCFIAIGFYASAKYRN